MSGYYFSIAAVVSWIVLVGACLSVLIQDWECGRLYVREMLKPLLLRRTCVRESLRVYSEVYDFGMCSLHCLVKQHFQSERISE